MAARRPGGPPPRLLLNLFGPFEARLHGAPLPRLHSRKGEWLLALLVLRGGREVDRAWLAGLLWPESAEPQALANLRNSLKDLRRALEPEAVRLQAPGAASGGAPRTLRLDLAGAEVDVLAFDQAIAEGSDAALEAAITLYRGPLLEGCTEEWVFQERQAREQAYLQALESLAAHAQRRGDRAQAERCLRQAVAAAPLRESAHRALMQALAGTGNYAAALLTYRELRLRLHRDLQAEPDPETTALFQQLRAEARGKADGGTGRRGDGAIRPDPSPPAVSPSPRLPVAPSPTGTLTFIFTDVEGSVKRWEEQPEAMRAALARHDALLRQAIEAYEGVVFKRVGDAFCAAFTNAPDAVGAALAAQRALQSETWGKIGPLRVRMALHTGAVEEREEEYFGPPLNRVARLLEAGHGGQVLLSLATQELARDALPEDAELRDLGEHRLEDLIRPERVFELSAPELQAGFPPLKSLDTHPHNLPSQPTPLLGREDELRALRALLQREEVRLVTLTGPGGTGKTRLGLQAAADRLRDFGDGIFFVALAPISDPGLVTSTIAQALGVREASDRPLQESLQAHLRRKKLLLLLDNFEQVLEAAPLVAELIAGCPQVKVLMTSRAALHLRGEHEFPVPPLALPDPKQLPLAGALSQYAAVELFIQRALAVKPDFQVTNENAPAVAEICCRLDGLPLAIELAAARIKLLPPEALVARLAGALGARLRLLTGGPRDLPARQQTLRSTIAWSYDLLPEAEKVLFQRLSVFVSGCTLEAAEAVCNPDGELGIEVLDGIASLVDQSLLWQHEGAAVEPRFGMLETIREFGQEHRDAAQEAAALRHRHAAFFRKLAEQAVPSLRLSDLSLRMEWLEREHDNLRAALEWCIRSGAVEVGLPLSTALARFWKERGHLVEGRRQMARLLAIPAAAEPTLARAKALLGAAGLAWVQDDYEAARSLAEESLAIGRERGDPEIIGCSLNTLARVAIWRPEAEGDLLLARALLEESLAISRRLGHSIGAADSLQALAEVAMIQDDLGSARTFLEESLALYRSVGNQGDFAWTLWHLGNLSRRQHDLAAARARYEEGLLIFRKHCHVYGFATMLQSLGFTARLQSDWEAARSFSEEAVPLFRELGNRNALAYTLDDLGEAGLRQGDLEAAHTFYGEALGLWRELSMPRQMVATLQGLADVVEAQGQKERSVQLLAAAAAIRETGGEPPWSDGHPAPDKQVSRLRAALGEERFAAAWAEGQAMSLDEAVAFALAEQEAPNRHDG